jgi:NitT/TauT family transport system substrate-binding protein
VLAVILLAQALTVAVAGPPGSPEYLPVRVAEAEGYFAREGLAVTLRTTRAEAGAAEALAQGQADLAATSLEAVLRFGLRPPNPVPRLVFALSAAPAAALLVASADAGVASVADLAGARIGVAMPGGAERTWLQALLARARLKPAQAAVVSLGRRGVVGALESGEARAAIVSEPAVSALLAEGRARLLVDLRSPPAARRALGVPTVNAAVFARADERLGHREIAAFARALLAAERRIASATAAELAGRLPGTVVGIGDDFARRVEASRAAFVPDGLVGADAVRATAEMIRAHLPLPRSPRIPRPDDLLHLEPLRRVLGPRPSG